MAIHHIPDGKEFQYPSSFGFHGSANTTDLGFPEKSKPTRERGHKGPHNLSHDGAEGEDVFGKGGHIHPHGHEVIHAEHHADGGVTHHHAHGGFTHHHPEGHVTHHDSDGAELETDHRFGKDSMGIVPERHAHGGPPHPHGHDVVHVERTKHGEVHHHAHGGMTVHHPDGNVSHYGAGGEALGTPTDLEGNQKHGHRDFARGGHCFAEGGFESEHEENEGELGGKFARGGAEGRGDMAEDKALVKKAFKQHDEQEHHGEHTNLKLRRGGVGALPPAAPPPGLGRMPMAPPRRRPPSAPPPAGGPEPDFSGADGSALRRGGRARR